MYVDPRSLNLSKIGILIGPSSLSFGSGILSNKSSKHGPVYHLHFAASGGFEMLFPDKASIGMI